jgi:hypothetical protein
MIAESSACVGFRNTLPKPKARILFLRIEYGFNKFYGVWVLFLSSTYGTDSAELLVSIS